MSTTDASPRDVWGTMRHEISMRSRIAEVLADGPKNIPAIAEALGYPDYEVTHWVMGMWRYGRIIEVGSEDDDGYYQYAMASDASEAGGDQ